MSLCDFGAGIVHLKFLKLLKNCFSVLCILSNVFISVALPHSAMILTVPLRSLSDYDYRRQQIYNYGSISCAEMSEFV